MAFGTNGLISLRYENFSKNTAPAPPPRGRQQSQRSQLHTETGDANRDVQDNDEI